MLKYKLPQSFGTLLNRKFKNNRQALTENEFSDNCRRLANSTVEHNYALSSQSLSYTVSKLINKYEHLMIDPDDPLS